MRVGVVLAPIADPRTVVDGARATEEAGLDAVALWDHVHSLRPDWGYAAGWSMWGAIAQATEHVRLVPMVLNGLLHDVGRLAKETAMLDLLSGGRFELAIGLGDWPESYAAWGQPFPPLDERITRLRETLEGLDAVWRGDAVSSDGAFVRLGGAISSPAPASRIRVVLGAGGSRRVIRELASMADELNVYPEPALIDLARNARGRATGPMAVSVHLDWSWDKWPPDPHAELSVLAARGVDRAFVAVGADDMPARIAALAAAGTG
jgi:alkanesulfonate monooxygenase SsuD/methylene tetrahydromethanopterin reductase-like flavin-dependent oxidoreductase (luciferase family)